MKTVKIKKYSIPRIGLDQFESRVIQETKPILLACINHGIVFPEQIAILKDIEKNRRETLKVYLLDSDEIQSFAQEFGMEGTPTYFLFYKGKEVDRLLGESNFKDLERFLGRQERVGLERK